MGFRAPLFLLGLAAAPVAQQAGFTAPQPVLGISSVSEEQQAGYRNPLPLPQIGGGADQQAGFVSPIPVWLGQSGAEIPEPPAPARAVLGRHPFVDEEEEEIIAIAMAIIGARYGNRD